MLSVAVFCLNGRDSSIRSVETCGQAPTLISMEDLSKQVMETKADAIHIVQSSTIVLPAFYDACLTQMEYGKFDFVLTECMSIPSKQIIKNDKPIISQHLIRSWVFKEYGFDKDLPKLFSGIRGEYRGNNIPHVLCVEV